MRIEDYREILRGHRVLHLVGKGGKPATMPLTVTVLRVLEACCGERIEGRPVLVPVSGKPGRPPRLLPAGEPDRESRRDTQAYQPALATPC